MFYPFITKKPKSEGLGLTYVNLMVSKYGGYLRYEREKDRESLRHQKKESIMIIIKGILISLLITGLMFMI